MKFTSPMRQLAALALTAVFLTTAALSGFAVYAMPIQAAYPLAHSTIRTPWMPSPTTA